MSAWDGGGEDSDRTERLVALGLLVGGRVLILAEVAAVAGCRLTRPWWISAPRDAGLPSHWIVGMTFVTTAVFTMLLPFLILPVGSWALVIRSPSELMVRTVLGTRRVSTESVRVTRLTLPGRATDTRLLVLRDWRNRMVIVGRSTFWRDMTLVSGHDGRPVSGLRKEWADGASRGRRARRFLAGLLLIMGWACAWFIVAPVLMTFAGVPLT